MKLGIGEIVGPLDGVLTREIEGVQDAAEYGG
jgi:hypothetical protein